MITTKEAAGILGVTPIRIRQLIKEGRLPAEKIGRDYLIDVEGVERFSENDRPARRPTNDERLASQITLLEEYVARKRKWLKDRPMEIQQLKENVGKEIGSDPRVFQALLEDMPQVFMADGDLPEPTFGEQATHAALTLFALHGDDGAASETISKAVTRLLMTSKDASFKESIFKQWKAMLEATDYLTFEQSASKLIKLFAKNDINIKWPRFASDVFLLFQEGTRFTKLYTWQDDVMWH